MHALSSWFIRNPVAANLVMIFIIVAGLQSVINMRVEGFPQIPTDIVEIDTDFPDATPAQVDQLVTLRIEDALRDLEGVRSVSSRSREGRSSINVRKTAAQELDDLAEAIRQRVDGIEDLPDSARRPIIDTEGWLGSAVYISLHGETDHFTRQRLARALRDDLLDRSEISRVEVWGLLQPEISISVDPAHLQLLGLTPRDIAERIQGQSINLTAGNVRTESGTVVLRTDSEAKFARDFATLPIIETADGRSVLLGDIASIREAYDDRDSLFRYNGAAAVTINIDVGQQDDLLDIAHIAREVSAEFALSLPAGLDVTVWGDYSRYIDDRLDLLQTNGLLGLGLVLLLLALFLDLRVAFWVAVGVPVSVLGAFAVAGTPWFGFTLNDVTTFGLIIALGILVDDAVIVGESVHDARQGVTDAIRGTEAGVFSVMTPTVFGVATTIAAFLPMALIDNEIGQVLASFAGMIVLALCFSIFESKCILPAHLAKVRFDRSESNGLWERCQRWSARALVSVRDGPYQRALNGALMNRFAIVLLCVSVAITGFGLLAKGRIATAFFPQLPEQVLWVRMTMDSRAPFELTSKNLAELESTIARLDAELTRNYDLRTPPVGSAKLFFTGGTTGHLGLELSPVSERPGLSSGDIARYIRDSVPTLEGVVNLTFGEADGFAGGFSMNLYGPDQAVLQAAATALISEISQIEGVRNARASLTGARPELTVSLRTEAQGLGITPDLLAEQVAASFGGIDVQRVLRQGQEIDVRLQLTDTARDQLGDVLEARIQSPNGTWFSLSFLADIRETYAPLMVQRFNGDLVNTISATLDPRVADATDVFQVATERILPDIRSLYHGVELAPGGAIEERRNIEVGLISALILSLISIYALLAIPLKSYLAPFLIFAVLPFGFLGAVAGHVLMGLPISLLSIFGMLALAGIMVNDSLVLMTRYKAYREKEHVVQEAIEMASSSRFKAIFLTTATTSLGLGPLILETSEQAQILVPAAVSLSFGLITATVVTLILLPILISIFEGQKYKNSV
ncbi:MAG: efflux RND transporter permease subunit [Pseudomonadota bacterium]